MADEKTTNETTTATFEKITDDKIEKIKGDSVISLPDNPVAYGYSANEIRGRFVNPFFAEKDSLLAEILRIEDALEEWQKVPVETTSESQENPEGNAQTSSDKSPLVNKQYVVDKLIPNALNNEEDNKGIIRQAIAEDIKEAFKQTFENPFAIGNSLAGAKAFKILECNGTDTYTIIIGAIDSNEKVIFGYSASDFAEKVVTPINANKSDDGDNLNKYSVNFKEHYDLLGSVESISDTSTKEIPSLTKLALSTKLVDFGFPSDIVGKLDKFIVADVKVTNYRDDSDLGYEFGTNLEMFRIPSLPDIGNIGVAQYAFAAGEGAQAKMNAAIALGYLSEAIGKYSFAAGKKPIAAGYASTSLGDENKVVGREGFACNFKNEVYGLQSYAEGRMNKVYGDRCHAQGGSNEIAETASYSSAAGYGNKVKGDHQFVIGKFSDEADTTSPFIIGYGDAAGKKNIFKVKENGVAWQAGTPKDDKDLVNKKYVDDAIYDAITSVLEGEV